MLNACLRRRYNQQALAECVAETVLALLGEPSGRCEGGQVARVAARVAASCGRGQFARVATSISGPTPVAALRHGSPVRQHAGHESYATPPGADQGAAPCPLAAATRAESPLLEAAQLPHPEPLEQVAAGLERVRRLHGLA